MLEIVKSNYGSYLEDLGLFGCKVAEDQIETHSNQIVTVGLQIIGEQPVFDQPPKPNDDFL